jgi:hypothetical protein
LFEEHATCASVMFVYCSVKVLPDASMFA